MRLLLFSGLVAPFLVLIATSLPWQLAVWTWAPILVLADRLGRKTEHAGRWRKLALLVGGFWLLILGASQITQR